MIHPRDSSPWTEHGVATAVTDGVDALGDTTSTSHGTSRPRSEESGMLATLADMGVRDGLPFEGLEDDPGELVARAAEEALRAYEIVPSRAIAASLGLYVLILGAVEIAAPEAVANALWGMTCGGTLVAVLPLGARLRDHAWYRPQERPAVVGDGLPQFAPESALGPLALFVGPPVLGLLAGMGWFMMLGFPASVLSVLWLATFRLAAVVPGFPFVHPPSAREIGALAFAGLLVAAGTCVTCLLIVVGGAARLLALPAFLWTWAFAARLAGLWARAIQQRFERESRGL